LDRLHHRVWGRLCHRVLDHRNGLHPLAVSHRRNHLWEEKKNRRSESRRNVCRLHGRLRQIRRRNESHLF
jgi:hypothetical protein